MVKRVPGLSKERITSVVTRTSMSRQEIAEKIGVSKISIDRWCSTGKIAPENWRKLTSLLGGNAEFGNVIDPKNDYLMEVPLDHLLYEISRRGWEVVLLPTGVAGLFSLKNNPSQS